MLSFVAIKSFALALSSTRSLLLAAILGPKSYGVFGTLILVQQYLSYAALGIREGVTVLLARSCGEPDHWLRRLYASSLAWGIGIGLGLLVVLGAASTFGDGLVSYLGWVGVISLLSISNEILININRDQHKLKKIALLEVVYNAAPLGVALWLWQDVTIIAVLAALAAGLLVSVSIYLATLPRLKASDVDWAITTRLLGLGFPLALLSAVTLLVNSMFVLVANWLPLGDELGLVVFANNACVIILFGLNTIAWGATSRSMRNLYAGTASSEAERLRADRLRTVFRFGIIIAALACLSLVGVFKVVMTSYAGAEVFIFYLCLFQSYGLLLFDEINFLTVTSRSRWVIGAYCVLLSLVCSLPWLVPQLSTASMMLVGIVGYCVLAVVAVLACQSLGAKGGIDAEKLAFLLFPLVCAGLYAAIGVAGALLSCGTFALLAICFHLGRRRRLARRLIA